MKAEFEALDWVALAKSCYDAYCRAVQFSNYGVTMTNWENVRYKLQIGWEAAARQAVVSVRDGAIFPPERWSNWLPPHHPDSTLEADAVPILHRKDPPEGKVSVELTAKQAVNESGAGDFTFAELMLRCSGDSMGIQFRSADDIDLFIRGLQDVRNDLWGKQQGRV